MASLREARGLDTLLDAFTTIASQAAAVVLDQIGAGLSPHNKADGSPVSAADEAAEELILERLARLLPGTAVISEELERIGSAAELRDAFVLVDPLDGTRELIAGRDEFTVNIALILDGRPAVGVIAAPALSLVWRADQTRAERLALAPGAAASAAASTAEIRCRKWHDEPLAVAVSRSHPDPQTERFLTGINAGQRLSLGSSLKFCRLAEGATDLYPRFGTVMEWDVAAGHMLVMAAGGDVVTAAGAPLTYGNADGGFRVEGFIAAGDPDAARALGLTASRSG